ncbi:MAG: amino acid racemase [Actinomycetales bacterium]|nr:amino acid racemase [Actinomycetales bacterium]
MRRVGLIGGTTWTSTAQYYRLLNEGVAARLGGQHSADLVLRSVEFDEVAALQRAGDWAELGRRYRAEGELLARAGAEVVGILANTMHLVYDDVVAGAGVPVVHVVDEVATRANELGVTRLGLLGTGYTMSSDLYPRRLEGTGVSTFVPGDDDAAEVHRIIYEELAHDRVLESSRARLRSIVERLVERGAQAIVLGCTELPMILSDGDAEVPMLDTTALHVGALLDAAISPQSSTLEEGAA